MLTFTNHLAPRHKCLDFRNLEEMPEISLSRNVGAQETVSQRFGLIACSGKDSNIFKRESLREQLINLVNDDYRLLYFGCPDECGTGPLSLVFSLEKFCLPIVIVFNDIIGHIKDLLVRAKVCFQRRGKKIFL